MGFEITGLEELEKGLEKAVKKAPKEYEKLKNDIKDRVFKNTLKHIPVNKGRIIASFEKRTFDGKEEFIEEDLSREVFAVGTKVWYAHMIENGHKKKGGKGFVKGVKFMEQGLEETAKEIPEMAQDMLDRVLSDVK